MRYLSAARAIGEWIFAELADQSGTGFGGYFLGFPDQGVVPKALREGKSIENNADIYAAYAALAAVERRLGNPADADRWMARAFRAGDFVMAMFDPVSGCFFEGTVPVGQGPGDGGDPSGARKGSDIINAFRFLDANTFPTLALAAFPRYRDQIDWRRPLQCVLDNFAKTVSAAGQTFQGFNLIATTAAGPRGAAWEFTAQAVVTLSFVDRLLNSSQFANPMNLFSAEIARARDAAPFGDGRGLVAATLANGDQLTPIEQCLSTPFQCIPERVGLAATNWAIFAESNINPLLSRVIDSDGDGVPDVDEIQVHGTDPQRVDSDGDGLADGTELGVPAFDQDPSTTTDPRNPDSDGDGRLDGGNGIDPCEDCNNSGRVDAGESDPAAPEHFAVLHPGFNPLAYPGEPPAALSTCKDLLAALGTPGEMESIQRLDPITQRFEECDFHGATDFPIRTGEGYVARAKSALAVALPATAACPTLSLHLGLNLIGHPAPPADFSCGRLLSAIGSGAAGAAQRFSASTGRLESCTFRAGGGIQPMVEGTNLPVVAGEAYLVHMKAAAQWVLPGCESSRPVD